MGEDGQIKIVDFSDLDDAKGEYGKRFKSKTGLAWEDRTDEPKTNKYTFVERAYEDDADDEDDAAAPDSGVKQVESELDLPTQRLMELIFKYDLFCFLSCSLTDEIVVRTISIPFSKRLVTMPTSYPWASWVKRLSRRASKS